MAGYDLSLFNNGTADATDAIQSLLDAGGEIYLPEGNYRITRTLRIHSDTDLSLHRRARLFVDGDVPKHAGDFLLTNAGGDKNIRIRGGVWDGNNQGQYNVRGELLDITGYSGVLLAFDRLTDLTIEDVTLANPAAYYTRFCRLDGFEINDVRFMSEERRSNQDGIHLCGGCRNGVVRHLLAITRGQTRDDMIALNADDCMDRVECHGTMRGDIENVLFEDVYAEDCATILRLLSVTANIRNITFRRIFGGYHTMAVNIDAARYCRTPLFRDANEPNGVGRIENVTIDTFHCRPLEENRTAVVLESQCRDLAIRNFSFDNAYPGTAALAARYIPGSRLTVDGAIHDLPGHDDEFRAAAFRDLTVTRI